MKAQPLSLHPFVQPIFFHMKTDNCMTTLA